MNNFYIYSAHFANTIPLSPPTRANLQFSLNGGYHFSRPNLSPVLDVRYSSRDPIWFHLAGEETMGDRPGQNIFLWAIPRSISTGFFRTMESRKNCKVCSSNMLCKSEKNSFIFEKLCIFLISYKNT